MKILILSNNVSEKEWQPVLKEAKPFLTKLNAEYSIDIKEVDMQEPRQKYSSGSYGINQAWLKSISESYKRMNGNEHTIVIYYEPHFEVDGAWGFFMRGLSRKDLKIIQIFRPLTARNRTYNEFRLDVARTLVHEVCHAKSFLLGIPDQTHDFQAKDNLAGFIDILVKPKQDPRLPLLLKIVELLKQKLALLKGRVEPYYGEPNIVLHHSATDMKTTRPETIEKYHLPKYGRCFYSKIIDHKGKVHIMHNEKNKREGYEDTIDICALGDFTYQVPTEAMIKALKKELGDVWTTHHELGKEGYATPSSCPGKLPEYLG